MTDIKKVLAKTVKFEDDTKSSKKSSSRKINVPKNIVAKRIEPFTI